jgi:hypothetical protein
LHQLALFQPLEEIIHRDEFVVELADVFGVDLGPSARGTQSIAVCAKPPVRQLKNSLAAVVMVARNSPQPRTWAISGLRVGSVSAGISAT